MARKGCGGQAGGAGEGVEVTEGGNLDQVRPYKAPLRTCEVRRLQLFHSLPALFCFEVPRPKTSPSGTCKVRLDTFPYIQGDM